MCIITFPKAYLVFIRHLMVANIIHRAVLGDGGGVKGVKGAAQFHLHLQIQSQLL